MDKGEIDTIACFFSFDSSRKRWALHHASTYDSNCEKPNGKSIADDMDTWFEGRTDPGCVTSWDWHRGFCLDKIIGTPINGDELELWANDGFENLRYSVPVKSFLIDHDTLKEETIRTARLILIGIE